MTNDGLAISTGIGEGAAQVLPDFSKGFNAAMDRRDKVLAAQQKEKLQMQADKLSELDDIEKIAIKGDVSHLQYLTDKKNELYKNAGQFLHQTKGLGDINQKFYSDINDIKQATDFAEQVKTYRTQTQQDIAQHYNKLDPKSIEEVKNYLQKSPQEQKNYILDKGTFPELKQKEAVLNYDSDISKLNVKPVENVTDINKGSYVQSIGGTYWNASDVNTNAKRFVMSGLPSPGDGTPRNLAAAKLIKDQRALLSDDVNFKILTPEEQDVKVLEAAQAYVSAGIMSRGGTKTENKIKDKDKTGYTLKGNVYSNNKYNITYDQAGKVYIEGTDPSENKKSTFLLSNGEEITGSPIAWDFKNVDKNGDPGLTISVPQPKDADGNAVPDKVVSIPFKDNKAKVESIIGTSFTDVIHNLDIPVGKKSKAAATKNTLPKKGDKKTFKQGPATYDGSKWVLDAK